MANRKAVTILVLLFLIAPAALLSGQREKGDAFVVSGIGYPPIKAQSPAQARLMARRAAIIDAYRNALALAGSTEHDEYNLYTGLSGFVKGMTVIEEEYLGDGGIRIVARVSSGDIVVKSKGAIGRIEKETGPSRVTLDEWYRIIEQFVKIEK